MKLNNINEIKSYIDNNALCIVYIKSLDCSVCESLFEKICHIADKLDIEINFVQFEEVKEIASFYSVFTAPLLITFAEGKEIFRDGRFLKINDFELMLKKYKDLLNL